MTILGFTGTRHAPTDAQLSWLRQQFEQPELEELHHGACVGADACAHVFALLYGIPTVVHPPVDAQLIDVRAAMPRSALVKVMLPKPYHARNRDIVNACDHLIALPNGPQRAHSGTWYTVAFATGKADAHELNHPVPVTICYPGGEVETR